MDIGEYALFCGFYQGIPHINYQMCPLDLDPDGNKELILNKWF